jgi:ferrous iron transport protein A
LRPIRIYIWRQVLLTKEPCLSTQAAPVPLANLHRGARGVVERVLDDESPLGEGSGATVVMRLVELGFVPGEAIEIIAEARPGGDPIAVRIGGSCFALRRLEAASVMITLQGALT